MTTSLPHPSNARTTWIILLLLLLLAALLRVPALENPGYTLDELWTAEVATGRGSMHLQMPMNTLITAPELFTLNHAPPFWNVWSHMQVTHPPLYYVMLRLWMEVMGQGDITERAFAVIASLMAIALLFDVTRLMNGRAVATWACLLMIVASPQVDFARKTRNYALVFLMLLAAADALVRIEQFGMNRRRWCGLMFALLASLLTHYFAVGTVVGLGIYAGLRLRGHARRQAIAAFAIASLLFILTWGPFFWQQRALLSVNDSGVSFVRDNLPGHVMRVIWLFLIAPATLLVARIHLHPLASLLAILYLVPFVNLRRRPRLLLWGLWLNCTLGAVGLLDLSRSSLHLGFVRYVTMASPAVFVLIAFLSSEKNLRWFRHAIPLMMVLFTAYFTRDAYYNPAADPRDIARLLGPKIAPADVIVFASTPESSWLRGTQYLMLSRYIKPISCPIFFVDAPVTGDLLRQIEQRRGAFVFSSTTAPSYFFPTFQARDQVALPSWGTLTLMVPATPLAASRK